jgi:hypothetical protein
MSSFAAMEERLESIAEILGREHRTAERKLRRIRERIVGGDRAGAESALRATAAEIATHLLAEEETLFPVLTALSGGRADSAIALLRKEHAQLRDLVEAVISALGEPRKALAALAELRRFFASHHRREEELCYPLTDELCPEPLRETVARRLRTH